MWGELAHSFQSGNGYLITIMIIGFFATVVFFERLIMLQFVYHIDFPKFLSMLRKMIQAEDLGRAINLCKSVSGTSLPHISLRALEAAEIDPTTIRARIDEETIDFLPNIEKRLGFIPAATLLIMMVGLLGTIDSLWAAFQSVDVLDTARKQATLARGISSSLNPTAIGLLFGMILLAGHHILKGIAINLTERIHHGVTVVTNILSPHEAIPYVTATPAAPMATNQAPASDNTATKSADDSSADTKNTTTNQEITDEVSVEDIKDEEEII